MRCCLKNVSATVTYETTVNAEGRALLYKANQDSYSFNNTATLNVSGNPSYNGAQDTATQTYKSQVLAKNQGQYDASTHQITWNITVNTDGFSLTDAQVTDTLPQHLRYVPSAGGGTPGVTGDPDSSGGQSVVFDLGTISGQQTITVTAELTDAYLSDWTKTGGSAAFTNKATLSSKLDGSTMDDISVTSKPLTISFPVIGKSGTYSDGCINWRIDVNASQFSLGDVVVSDTLQEGLIFSPDSVMITGDTVSSGGTVTPDDSKKLTLNQDYTVTAEPNQKDPKKTDVTVTFLIPVEKCYVLTFLTNLDSSYQGSGISNSASLGQITGGGSTGSSSSATVDMGGWVSGQTGSLTVTKEGAPPSGQTQTLAGAEFELRYYKSSTVYRGPQSTDANGQTTFSNINLYRYDLVETKAPDGYLLAAPISVKPDAATHSFAGVTVTDQPALGTVSFQKKLADGQTANGGAFQLTGTSYAGWTVDKTAGASDGTVTFPDVPVGDHYKITEVTPPDGYLSTDTVLYATVPYKQGQDGEPDQTGVGETVFTAADGTVLTEPAMTDALPSADISFTKVREGGAALEGAVFTLSDGKGYSQTAKSGPDGKVTFGSVPAGAYTVTETGVPAGYQAADPFDVTVTAGADAVAAVTGVPATVTDARRGGSGGGGGGGGGGGTTGSGPASSSSGAPVSSSVSGSPSSPAGSTSGGTPGASSAVSKAPGGGTAGTVLTGPASLYIKKTDQNGAALSGTEFTLFGADGKALQKKVTGSSGVVVFRDLPAGSYVVKETKAPAHYQLYSGELDVTLTAGQKAGYTLRDRPEGDDTGILGWTSDSSLPKTGEFPITPLAAGCGLLLILAGLAVRRPGLRRKRMKYISHAHR